MDGFYIVYFYNELDADFGYDPGPGIMCRHVDKATAKSIVRHFHKRQRKGDDDLMYMSYWYENDWED